MALLRLIESYYRLRIDEALDGVQGGNPDNLNATGVAVKVAGASTGQD